MHYKLNEKYNKDNSTEITGISHEIIIIFYPHFANI